MGYIIFDLDNCISDDAWRIPKIDWHHDCPSERYHRYHLLSGFDELKNRQLLDQWSNHGVLISTARPKTYSAITQEWLKRSGVDPVAIFMRPTDDHAHSVDLKRRHLTALLSFLDADISEILAAYDDRADVVSMYRDQGVPAVQVQIHDVCAYTNPNR